MAEVAALVGDPARANILDTLLDGRAFTATELAFAAKVGAPTASAHLAKLVDARLLSVVKTRYSDGFLEATLGASGAFRPLRARHRWLPHSRLSLPTGRGATQVAAPLSCC